MQIFLIYFCLFKFSYRFWSQRKEYFQHEMHYALRSITTLLVKSVAAYQNYRHQKGEVNVCVRVVSEGIRINAPFDENSDK